MSTAKYHVYFFIELTKDGVSTTSCNLVQRVSAAYSGLNASIEGVIIGENKPDVNNSLAHCGVKKVTHVKCPTHQLQSQAVKNAILNFLPNDGIIHIYSLNDIRVTGLTSALAAARRWPMYSSCTGIGSIESLTRPIFGGKIDEIRNVSQASCVISVRPDSSTLKVETVETEYRAIEISENTSNEYEITLRENKSKKSISEASVVISGGRGMKSAENFVYLFKFAEIVNGAVGASRPVVDSGWLSHEHQVGQTGQTISPNLYIACGISGSVQHMAGMSSSKCIVVINTDNDAPIFSIADYGIVGDALEILPQLTAEIEKLK